MLVTNTTRLAYSEQLCFHVWLLHFWGSYFSTAPRLSSNKYNTRIKTKTNQNQSSGEREKKKKKKNKSAPHSQFNQQWVALFDRTEKLKTTPNQKLTQDISSVNANRTKAQAKTDPHTGTIESEKNRRLSRSENI